MRVMCYGGPCDGDLRIAEGEGVQTIEPGNADEEYRDPTYQVVDETIDNVPDDMLRDIHRQFHRDGVGAAYFMY